MNKQADSLFDKNVALFSTGIAVLIMLAFGKKVNPAIEPSGFTIIKVTALGEKSDSSHSSEVWINQIKNDLTNLDITDLPLSNGWEIKYNSLVSYKAQPATLTIKIEDPVNPTLVFPMHSWSGKVKIKEGSKTTITDLYKDNPAGFYKYTSNVIIPNKGNLTITKVLLTSIAFIALFIFSYLSILVAKSKKNFFLLSIPLCLAIFSLPVYILPEFAIKILMLVVSIATAYIMSIPSANGFINAFVKPSKVIFAIIVVYSSFACIGFQLFLSDFPVNNVIQKIACFLLFNCWLALIAIAYLFATYLCKLKFGYGNKNTEPNKPYRNSIYLYFTFLSILLVSWSVYLIAFFPGNMTGDSIDQWGMAIGIYPLRDAHPIFHTLVVRLIISIAHTPAILALSQILFMATVCSGFLLFLYKAGIPYKWLFLFAVLLGIVPANGIIVVTLWKDIPYASSILWLTLVLAQIISKKYLFSYKITLFSLGASLIFVALFRHNGLLPVLLVSLVLILISIKERKKEILYPVLFSLAFVFSFNIITPSIIKVIPNPPGLKLAPSIHGIASVMYYNGKLTNETRREMEKIMPLRDWQKSYYPYSSDNYFFRSKPGFISDISQLPTMKVMKMYFTTFVDNPYLIVRDRLSGTDLVWNVCQPKDAFNGRFAPSIGDNTFGFKQNNSTLKEAIIKLLDISVEKADVLIWRPGIYNILLFFLILLVKHRKRYILIFLPLIGNYISLMIAMMHQDFRYVYSMPLLFAFVWLLLVSNALSVPEIKNSFTKNQQ